MRKNIGYSFLVLAILVVCLSVGIYLGFRYTKNDNNLADHNTSTQEDNKNDTDKTTTVSTKTYDIKVIYQDEYIKCGHVIENQNMVYGTTIEKLKEAEDNKQKQEGTPYDVVEESNERIVYNRKIEQNCPNHFLVKLEEGVVVIYNIVDDSAMTIYKKLEVDWETLNPEMLEELNIGIKAEGKENLNLIIEDIES